MVLLMHKTQRNGVVKGRSLLESCRSVQDMRDGTLNLPWSGQVDKIWTYA